MNSLPYYKNYPDDYLSGSIRLCSYETQGVFAILTNVLWKREGYLPDNIEEISLITGVESKSLAKALEQLKAKACVCFSNDGKIYVKFILEQLEKMKRLKAERVRCGKLGKGKHHDNQGTCDSKQKQSKSPSKTEANPLQAKAPTYAYGSNSLFLTNYLKEELRINTFLEVWDSWLEFRKAGRLPNTERALKLHIELLNKNSLDDAIAIIKNSIQANWKGLFPLKGNNKLAPHILPPKDRTEEYNESRKDMKLL